MSDYINNLITKVIRENEKLEAENTRLRRDLEANTNAFVSLQRDAEATTRQVQTLSDDRAMLQGQLQMSRAHVKELQASLDRLAADYRNLNFKLHLKTNTISEDGFINCATEYSADEQTATEVLEENNLKIDIKKLEERKYQLKTELHHSEQMYNRLTNELIAERAAHNKLKALCHERSFGTPLHPINQPRALPPWSVDFPTKDHGTITILFCNSPSVARLDDLQERLGATTWTITYNGFKK